MVRVLDVDDLAAKPGRTARFEGHEHGASVSIFSVRMGRGQGPGLHRHPYEETFVIQEGSATFTVDGETVEAAPGIILVVPPTTPHKFLSGPDGLGCVTVHGNDRMIQEELEGDGS